MRLCSRTTAAVLLAALLAAAARAKVAFTGYGRILAPADTHIRVRGPAAVLGGIPEGDLISKGFSLDPAGLFATTKVSQAGRVNLPFNCYNTLKAEALHLYYAAPTTAQAIILDGRLLQAAAVITF